jgi:hypothetical protein
VLLRWKRDTGSAPPPLDLSSSSEDEVQIPVISELAFDEFNEVGTAAVDGMD